VIGLLLTMIGARRAQAVTVFLLSAVAVAAAVAGPVALRTVDRAVGREEVAAASNTERSISVTAFTNPSEAQTAGQFDSIAKLITLPGFDPIRAGELEAFGPVSTTDSVLLAATSRIAFRERLCDHVVILSGRCLAGVLEVVIGEDTAAATHLRPGDITVVQAARYVLGRGLVPDGVPAQLTVVGVYRPRDPAEAYWAGQQYFPVNADGTRHEAVFTNVVTFDTIDHTLGQSSVDALALPSALALDRSHHRSPRPAHPTARSWLTSGFPVPSTAPQHPEQWNPAPSRGDTRVFGLHSLSPRHENGPPTPSAHRHETSRLSRELARSHTPWMPRMTLL